MENHLDWVCGDAMSLPFLDNSFDVYTISFGIRNVTRPEKALSEAYRVLRPGGRLMILEFSQIPNPSMQWAYDRYSFNIIPPMGKIIANDSESYQYPDACILRGIKPDKIIFATNTVHAPSALRQPPTANRPPPSWPLSPAYAHRPAARCPLLPPAGAAPPLLALQWET